jgi:hypothetical protein
MKAIMVAAFSTAGSLATVAILAGGQKGSLAADNDLVGF